MASARDSDSCSLCVECGKESNRALYKEFSGGTIQLSQCVSVLCGSKICKTMHGRLSHQYVSLWVYLWKPPPNIQAYAHTTPTYSPTPTHWHPHAQYRHTATRSWTSMLSLM